MKEQLVGTSHRWDLNTCVNCGLQRKNKSRMINNKPFKTKTVMVYFTDTATHLHAPPCPVK